MRTTTTTTTSYTPLFAPEENPPTRQARAQQKQHSQTTRRQNLVRAAYACTFLLLFILGAIGVQWLARRRADYDAVEESKSEQAQLPVAAVAVAADERVKTVEEPDGGGAVAEAEAEAEAEPESSASSSSSSPPLAEIAVNPISSGGSNTAASSHPHGHNPHHNSSGDNDDEDDDNEPADHELMHGEPGVADVLSGVFGPVNSMTEPDDGKWKTVLDGFKFAVELRSKPPIFVAKPLKALAAASTAQDKSLIAVLTRAIADSVAQAENSENDDAGNGAATAAEPAQFISFNCHDASRGFAHDALLAAVRGAAIANCFLPKDTLATLTPPIMAAARLNLVEDKMRMHALPTGSNRNKTAAGGGDVEDTAVIALDAFPLESNRVAMMHVAGLSMPQIEQFILSPPSNTVLGTKTTHLVIDIPSTTSVSDSRLQHLLNTMHDTHGFDLCILPKGATGEDDRTYNKVAHASYMGSEYAADGFGTRFIYVPNTDYDLVKETLEGGGVGGEVRLWWVRREDVGVKALMKTRHHAH
ncbi:hypothetical protein BDZ88DRAFT_451780 [Geranomyces variabilis]|nr:hypothetical protein BDZ88DRAFT_451780 [Geranomyces variabilis]KAJ3136289.1 hypothetical protein HDU90_003341 [Geranomyces variabilis]